MISHQLPSKTHQKLENDDFLGGSIQHLAECRSNKVTDIGNVHQKQTANPKRTIPLSDSNRVKGTIRKSQPINSIDIQRNTHQMKSGALEQNQ
jgi:hypothetical protein